MGRLRARLGWPSDLAVFQHDKMVIVDTNREQGFLSTNRSIGSRVPMLASATGRVYLACTSAQERSQILDSLAKSTDPYEQLARDRAAANRLLAQTAKRGYGLSNQEFLKTNRGAAVAVMCGDKVVCVINLIAIASVVSIDVVKKRYVPMLLDAKLEFEETLGRLLPTLPSSPLRVVRHSASGKSHIVIRKVA
jgi:IclR family mhp operon transcriptional activator